jgi:DNA adenine methylase
MNEQAIKDLRSYPGGKAGSGVYQTIINLMPPHSGYVEPFLGGGAIMRHKKPASWSMGFDLSRNALADFAIRAAHNDQLASVELICENGLYWLERNCCDDQTLIYCDPPYLMSTRKSGPLYEFEMSDEEHRDLLDAALKCSSMVMISGYPNDMYDQALKDWNSKDFYAMTRSGKKALERVWYNYPTPVRLHDYRYLGATSRQRQDIKRKQARWAARLDRMNLLEAQAMWSVIESKMKTHLR